MALKQTELIQRALHFAREVHLGQRRRYTGRPYYEHPLAVATLLSRFEHDESMLAAALLHDVIEDGDVLPDRLRIDFGRDVERLVVELSDVSGPLQGHRAARKAVDLAHAARSSPRAKTIRALDQVHNTVAIARHDPGFAPIYLEEKRRVLEVLEDASDPRAVSLARRVHARAVQAQWLHERDGAPEDLAERVRAYGEW